METEAETARRLIKGVQMKQALPAAMRMGIRMRARVSANGLLFREDDLSDDGERMRI